MKEVSLRRYFILFFGAILISFTFLDPGNLGGRALFDEENYYYPSILHFFNGLSLQDYPAAIAPGYFYSLSLFNDNLITLKLINVLINLSFLYFIIKKLKIKCVKNYLLVLPLCTSLYFVSSTLWLSPDNSSFFLSALTVYSYCLFKKNNKNNMLIIFSVLLFLAVWYRQTNLYLVAAFLLTEFTSNKKNKNIVPLIIAFTPSLFSMAYLFFVWKGLTPPSFSFHETKNIHFSALSHFFSLYFFYGVFFLGKPAYQFFRLNHLVLAKWLIISLLFTLIFCNTQNAIESGTLSGGIIKFALASNDIFGYNSFLFITCTLGVLLYAYSLIGISSFEKTLTTSLCVFFVLSLVPNSILFERYYSLFIYFLLIYITVVKNLKPSRLLIPLSIFNIFVSIYKIGNY